MQPVVLARDDGVPPPAPVPIIARAEDLDLPDVRVPPVLMHRQYANLDKVGAHRLALPGRYPRPTSIPDVVVRAVLLPQIRIEYIVEDVLAPLPPQGDRDPPARLADVDGTHVLEVVEGGADPHLHPLGGVTLVEVEVHIERDRGNCLPSVKLDVDVVGLQPIALPVRVEGRIAELVDAVPRLGGAKRPARSPPDLADRRGHLGVGKERQRGGGFEAEVTIIAGSSVGDAVGVVGVAVARGGGGAGRPPPSSSLLAPGGIIPIIGLLGLVVAVVVVVFFFFFFISKIVQQKQLQVTKVLANDPPIQLQHPMDTSTQKQRQEYSFFDSSSSPSSISSVS